MFTASRLQPYTSQARRRCTNVLAADTKTQLACPMSTLDRWGPWLYNPIFAWQLLRPKTLSTDRRSHSLPPCYTSPRRLLLQPRPCRTSCRTGITPAPPSITTLTCTLTLSRCRRSPAPQRTSFRACNPLAPRRSRAFLPSEHNPAP